MENQQTSKDPPPIIIYDDEDVSEGIRSCSKSLVGKILTKKLIHTNSLLSALAGIWCNPKGLRIEECGSKTFQFFFEEESDVDRILSNNPWLFRNSWLVLKKWHRGIEIEKLNFTKIPVRMQLWGLPTHCRTPKMGMKIGSSMGKVLESDIYETKEAGAYIRTLVEIDSLKPLLPGITVGSKKDGLSWVDFKYERLPQFCYKCGLIGHEEDHCSTETIIVSVDDQDVQEFGPWMRASQVGRKLSIHSHQKKEDDMGIKKKKQFPIDVTALLSGLSVSKPHASLVMDNASKIEADPVPLEVSKSHAMLSKENTCEELEKREELAKLSPVPTKDVPSSPKPDGPPSRILLIFHLKSKAPTRKRGRGSTKRIDHHH
ncbi:Zinc finger, CCHC-type [Sesbania bispinosa]|nr:Zinc finger, CCHC-type [Sesbania bispinosa]